MDLFTIGIVQQLLIDFPQLFTLPIGAVAADLNTQLTFIGVIDQVSGIRTLYKKYIDQDQKYDDGNNFFHWNLL
jgi:hypothetical protein